MFDALFQCDFCPSIESWYTLAPMAIYKPLTKALIQKCRWVGGIPGLVVVSRIRGREFESRHRIIFHLAHLKKLFSVLTRIALHTRWTFFTLIYCKIVLFEKFKNEKEAGIKTRCPLSERGQN